MIRSPLFETGQVIKLKPIGIIRTPYKEPKGIPIQGKFEKGVRGTIQLSPEYQRGLKDIEGFSHLILIYYFDRSGGERLVGKPFLEDNEHGIFAIRSPHRPNHIGFSIVKAEKVKDNTIIFSEVDMLDKTPLLDIKPYVSYFDSRKYVKNGWIERHFKNRKIPKRRWRMFFKTAIVVTVLFFTTTVAFAQFTGPGMTGGGNTTVKEVLSRPIDNMWVVLRVDSGKRN